MNKQVVLAAVFSVIIFGFGLPNSAFAIGGIVPIDLSSLGDEVGRAVEPVAPVAVGVGDAVAIVWAASNGNEPSVTMTPSDLGVDSVGTLPTSPFYFLKEWKRGITRFFTFGSIAKAELELNITNQIAAEVLEVEKAYDACAANALGGGKSCKPEDEVGAVKKALENFTDAQERLNARTIVIELSEPVSSENARMTELLKNIDEKTAKHAALLEQVSARVTFTRTGTCGALSTFCQQYEDLQSSVDNAQDTILKTFTITVTPINDAPSLKQKAEEQIKRAGIAIVTVDVVSPTGGEDSLKVTVPKQTQGATFGEKTKAPGSISGKEMMDAITVAKAKGNLADAKKAFAEGKYGEAYGLARSAEAMVADTTKGTQDIDNQAAGKEYGNKTAPASPGTSSKEKVKIIENESPRPTDKEEAAPKATTTPEKEKTETAKPSDGSAGSASNYDRDN